MAKGNKLIDDHKQISVNLVKYKAYGHKFEIAIEPNKTITYLDGDKSIAISEIVQSNDIFNDMKKGMIASPETLKEVFGTVDTEKIAKVMLEKGEVQFTHEYRTALREQNVRKIVNYIHRNSINPKTKLPHPINRIEAAMNEAKIRVDERKPIEAQIKQIITALQPIIPISMEENTLEIHIPQHYASKVQSLLKNKAKMIKESWIADGSCLASVKLPAGSTQDFIAEINSQTHGSATVEIKK